MGVDTICRSFDTISGEFFGYYAPFLKIKHGNEYRRRL